MLIANRLLLSIAAGWLFHCPTVRCLLLTPIRPAVNKISLTFYSSLKSHSIAYLNKRAYVLHISSKVVYNLTNHHHPRHLSRQPESVLSCPIFFVLLQHNVRPNRSPAHRKTIATGTHRRKGARETEPPCPSKWNVSLPGTFICSIDPAPDRQQPGLAEPVDTGGNRKKTTEQTWIIRVAFWQLLLGPRVYNLCSCCIRINWFLSLPLSAASAVSGVAEKRAQTQIHTHARKVRDLPSLSRMFVYCFVNLLTSISIVFLFTVFLFVNVCLFLFYPPIWGLFQFQVHAAVSPRQGTPTPARPESRSSEILLHPFAKAFLSGCGCVSRKGRE